MAEPSNIRPKDWQQTGNGRLSEKQRRMFNAVCHDLQQIHWHGNKLNNDDWRHLFSAVAAGQRMMPGWQYDDGRPPGFIMLGKSSLSLTRSQASDAITMAIQLGDDPESQGIKAPKVQWSDTVLLGMGFNPGDFQ